MGEKTLGRVLGFLFLASGLYGQEQTGRVSGTVQDPSHRVVPGVELELTGPAPIGVARTHTDVDGRFRFPALPPGRYDLQAEHPGFRPVAVPGLDVLLGTTLDVDLVLTLAGVSEEVSVTYEPPRLDVTSSASSHSIRGEWLHALPRGRDYTSVVSQVPGVADEELLAGVAIDGAGASENQYLIDGADTGDLLNGLPATRAVTDFVDEIQVKTGGYQAEFAASTGGVVSVRTRSGGDRLSGELIAYFSTDSLTGSARPILSIDPEDDTRVVERFFPKDDLATWEPGFTLGGPLLRDRLWFFAGYLPSFRSTSRTVTFLANGATRTFREKQRRHHSTARISARLGPRVRGSVAFNMSPEDVDGRLPFQGGTDSPETDFDSLGTRRPGLSLSGHVDVLAADDLQLSFRGSFFRNDFRRVGVPDEIRYIFRSSSVGLADVPESLQRPAGFQNIVSNFSNQKTVGARTAFQADALLHRSWAGEHAIKAGVQFEKRSFDYLTGTLQPNVWLFWDRALTSSDGRRVRGPLGYYMVSRSGLESARASDNFAFFLQDDWRVASRLTLHMGLRAEQEKVPSLSTANGEDEFAIRFGFGDKLAPRLGFALDAAGDGRWKLYGSWGLFYDTMKYAMPTSLFGGGSFSRSFYSLDTPDWPSIGRNGVFPGTFYETLEFSDPANDPEDSRIDPDLEPMRARELSVGIEHALGADATISLRYVRTRLDKAVEDVGRLVPGVGEEFFVANPGFGIARHLLGDHLPAQPPARRDYDAVELHLRRRLAGAWALQASYVWSRLRGNYSGLVGSDESGRTGANQLRVFDQLLMSFDQRGEPISGPLATDRPHQLDLHGILQVSPGTSAGVRFRLASGTPITREVFIKGVPVFYLGRGSDGRTPVFSQLDLYLQHELRLGERWRLRLSVNALNLLDQQTVTQVGANESFDDIFVTEEDFFAGVDIPQLMEEQGIVRNPFFGHDLAWQAPREIRLGLSLTF